MKIDKQYLANNRNKETQTCKVRIAVPWNKANFAAVCGAVDDALPDDCQEAGLVSYEPISYNHETKTFDLEVEIDVQDIDFEDEE